MSTAVPTSVEEVQSAAMSVLQKPCTTAILLPSSLPSRPLQLLFLLLLLVVLSLLLLLLLLLVSKILVIGRWRW